jgi:ubiquinone/menaquinone biosynthesis C-methylase UbiE
MNEISLRKKERMKDRISEKNVISDRELAMYYSMMSQRYMRIPCERVLKRVMAKGTRAGMALDVGTGPGIFPIFLARALPKLRFKAIDLSTEMIDIARRNAEGAGVNDRVEFEVGSAYSLPCEDHSIDLLICINTLHHFEQPVAFFNEAARVLKEDGVFVMTDFHRDTSSFYVVIFNLLWRLFFGSNEKAKGGFLESVQSSYTLNEIQTFLQNSKLKGWSLYTRTIEMWLESRGRR